MEYKVEINSLENFKAWSGGLETLFAQHLICHLEYP